jgi:hypothetical protein
MTALHGRTGTLRARRATVLILALGGVATPSFAQKMVFARLIRRRATMLCLPRWSPTREPKRPLPARWWASASTSTAPLLPVSGRTLTRPRSPPGRPSH